MSLQLLDARVDLHMHSTHSDGTYTPAQLVDLGRRAGLPALALTDHDSIAGLAEAKEAAGADVELVAGVEITTEFQEREVHLLGYYFDPKHPELLSTLAQLRKRRAERFQEMVDHLWPLGVRLESADVQKTLRSPVVGRRQLAELLVATGHAGSARQAFARYLGDRGGIEIPSVRLPVAKAIAAVQLAGGVAACAHPPYDWTRVTLAELKRCGLQAVEVDFPAVRNNRARQLRQWAAELGLAVVGGSDCHGPGDHRRDVGARGITVAELQQLRQLALV